MESDLAERALELGRAQFVASLPRWFLIVPVDNAPQPPARFRTVTYDHLERVAAAGRDDDPSLGLKSPRWQASPWSPESLKKRDGSPFSDRISIGRAPNVDIVIRSRFVSKLHAHVVVAEGQAPTVTDLDSQNGTFVDGARLTPHEPRVISNGSIVSFGQVHCELGTADVVYYALRRKYLLLIESSKAGPGTAAR